MGYPPMKSSVTEDELVRLETRHKPMKYPRRTKEVCGWDSRLWPCDVAILVAALRATPVADTAGIDAAWAEAEALSSGALTLEYVVYPKFVEAGEERIAPYRCSSEGVYAWADTPAAALLALAAALRTPKPEGER